MNEPKVNCSQIRKFKLKMAESSDSLVTNNINIQKHSSSVDKESCVEDKKTEKVMEPMLLEDYKFNEEPKILTNLLISLKSECSSPTLYEVMSGLVYILMLESGFDTAADGPYADQTFEFSYKHILDLSCHLPKNWRKDNFCSFSFVLQPFTQHECQVSCVPSADDLLINCIIRSVKDSVFNMILDPLAYTVNFSEDLTSLTFQNLKGLSQAFKNRISFPAKCAILEESEVKFACLLHLPQEVILQIMQYLNARDLLTFGQCCKYLRRLTQEPKLWKMLIHKELGYYTASSDKTYQDLLSEYQSILRRKRLARTRSRPLMVVTI